MATEEGAKAESGDLCCNTRQTVDDSVISAMSHSRR